MSISLDAFVIPKARSISSNAIAILSSRYVPWWQANLFRAPPENGTMMPKNFGYFFISQIRIPQFFQFGIVNPSVCGFSIN